YPDQGRFQTWDFASLTMKSDKTLAITSQARIEGIAMGSQSEGPLLVVWDLEPPASRAVAPNALSQLDPRVRAVLIDPNRLAPLRIGVFKISPPGPFNRAPLDTKDRQWFVPHPSLTHFEGVNSPLQVRASAQGDLFTISAGNGSALIANWDFKSRR